MRDITEELSKATSVPRKLWEFEDLMKDVGGYKHKNMEEIDNGCKKRVHTKNKKVFRNNKAKEKAKRYITKRNKSTEEKTENRK